MQMLVVQMQLDLVLQVRQDPNLFFFFLVSRKAEILPNLDLRAKLQEWIIMNTQCPIKHIIKAGSVYHNNNTSIYGILCIIFFF